MGLLPPLLLLQLLQPRGWPASLRRQLCPDACLSPDPDRGPVHGGGAITHSRLRGTGCLPHP